MYLKNALIGILLLISNVTFSQIKIDDVGDGWKSKVDSAILLIQEKDPKAYKLLTDHCKDIEFIIGDHSTTKLPSTIAITVKDMNINSINNIAAILVHESYHLYIWKAKIRLTEKKEEHDAYLYEYEFLCKLSDPENWLFLNAVNQIIKNQ
jgi:hypothetical protein